MQNFGTALIIGYSFVNYFILACEWMNGGSIFHLATVKKYRMLASAIQETPLSSSDVSTVNPCEKVTFPPTSSINDMKKINTSTEATHSDRNRAYSLSTDDEFCMVDEDIIGSGVTNPTGEPNIKYIGSQSGRCPVNPGITLDPHHFRFPTDWHGDVLAALPADFPTPIARYLLRDISISLHIYGGSDLSDDPPKQRSYSTAEYREGKGKNQFISPDAVGGKHRDHSVCVVLELSKITFVYQLFNKNCPLMSMKLFTIHNIRLLDKLVASQIKEMMYQYSSAEQPRRTCAPMLAVRMVETHKNEGKLRVWLLANYVIYANLVPDIITNQPLLESSTIIKPKINVPSTEIHEVYRSPIKGESFGTKSCVLPCVSSSGNPPVELSSSNTNREDSSVEGLVSALDDLCLAGDWNSSGIGSAMCICLIALECSNITCIMKLIFDVKNSYADFALLFLPRFSNSMN
ncbi:hypothetical protein DICVIV_10034 [Dictyocaulus viviparus]|uniref:Autophagy-related protein 2 n=1 Tax=Dictyocaulus viviparus TaxID=29172 RepID=A0A0D8XH15_DICVI|nr:hypothetical protein DICVIV_10034 [Dictyocaulus viviparus]